MDYRLGLYEKAMPSDIGWERMLAAARDAGFDHVEISIDESDARLARLEWTVQERQQMLQIMERNAMPIRTMCLSAHRRYPLGSHDQQKRERGMEIFKSAVELACDLGIRIIQLAGYDVYYEQGDDVTGLLFTQNLRRCVQFAAQFGVTLGFETMETPFMDTISKGMRFIKEINSPYLGMYPDLGNLNNAALLYDLNVLEEINAGKGHIFAMHLKETEEGKYRDMSFGAGRVNFAAGIRQALEIGVGLFVAEYWHEGSPDWQTKIAEINRFLRTSFESTAEQIIH